MHIHGYQIHNVLNVYRKQLSSGTAGKVSKDNQAKSQSVQERIDIAGQGQRKSLFDKISSEIVQRITQFGPHTELESDVSDQSLKNREPERGAVDVADGQSPTFTYTLIDRHNKKTTHNLSVRQLHFSTKNVESLSRANSNSGINSESE